MIPAVIFEKFGITGVKKVSIISSGLLHCTFLVRSKGGDVVVQKLHTVIKQNTCEDAFAITTYAQKKGIPVPKFLVTTTGKSWVRYEGKLWRVMRCIPGVTKKRATPTEAESAGHLLAEFHAAVKSFSYQCRGSIPHFHDTPFIYERFKKVLKQHQGGTLYKAVAPLAEAYLRAVPKFFLPKNLKQQIVHGDLKISNFLFKGKRATAILDFDTGMRHTPLVDVGDALRSWTNKKSEDGKALFDKKIYDAFVAGYLEKAALNRTEQALIPQAFRLMTLECGMRFLKDYFEDSYFGWNPKKFPSRRAHNLVRAEGQMSLFKQTETL